MPTRSEIAIEAATDYAREKVGVEELKKQEKDVIYCISRG